MLEILQKVIDRCALILLGINKKEMEDDENSKKITYTISSVFPSVAIMNEVEKFL